MNNHSKKGLQIAKDKEYEMKATDQYMENAYKNSKIIDDPKLIDALTTIIHIKEGVLVELCSKNINQQDSLVNSAILRL